jgi:NADH-quinone oxidoreductase subunit J
MLYSSLVCLFVFLGLGVFLSSNPVYNILFLILSVVNAGFLLFCLNVEFLALALVIVYVGAVAVLFLFIIMMLNLKLNYDISYAVFPFFFLIFFIFSQFFLSYKSIFSYLSFVRINESLLLVDSVRSLDIFGQAFFSSFLGLFLIAGGLLLMAALTVIILVLNHNLFVVNKGVYAQLSRGFINLKFS